MLGGCVPKSTARWTEEIHETDCEGLQVYPSQSWDRSIFGSGIVCCGCEFDRPGVNWMRGLCEEKAWRRF
jgi:hypothetical protein